MSEVKAEEAIFNGKSTQRAKTVEPNKHTRKLHYIALLLPSESPWIYELIDDMKHVQVERDQLLAYAKAVVESCDDSRRRNGYNIVPYDLLSRLAVAVTTLEAGT